MFAVELESTKFHGLLESKDLESTDFFLTKDLESADLKLPDL